jgi:site-specific recombinase XerD
MGSSLVALGSLLADAGLRVSEALGLTSGDVSLSEGWLLVRAASWRH